MAEAGHDTLIVTGGDDGMNEFLVQPHIRSFADLKGKVLVVDAPNTAYAVLAKKILQKEGLQAGRDYTVKPVGRGELRLKAMAESKENAAAILNLPFTIQGEAIGLRSLGNPVEILGPYQAGGAWLLRSWARANERTLVRYIAAYVEALRWSLASANREESIAILMDRLKLSRDVAERTLRALADPRRGFTPDAAFDREGFRNLLALRAEVEGGTPGAPEKYYDLSYYERALAGLKRSE
jgi:ABC-type nitrate/sulfonate/bicarbonate transport system substrate-binding protein